MPGARGKKISATTLEVLNVLNRTPGGLQSSTPCLRTVPLKCPPAFEGHSWEKSIRPPPGKPPEFGNAVLAAAEPAGMRLEEVVFSDAPKAARAPDPTERSTHTPRGAASPSSKLKEEQKKKMAEKNFMLPELWWPF